MAKFDGKCAIRTRGLCAFSGLDVEEHLQLIGYLLELILLLVVMMVLNDG
jgi:hypothetical protein